MKKVSNGPVELLSFSDWLSSSNPRYTFVGAIVEMTVRCLGKEFSAAVMDGDDDEGYHECKYTDNPVRSNCRLYLYCSFGIDLAEREIIINLQSIR